ncbi:unnamed protein product [Heterotrigona itama]|uniref:Uncharacterized protein n=1 Tax=Heterotrigona itama TaxID=395501 RepID=A0A6V7HKF7_9HYME|nr:unnamed protein product [Heterotrigona itama]
MLVCALADEKYTTKYDNIDLDSILNSDRLLNNYINCLLDVGSCTPDAKELKKSLPDALENECEKCSEKQKTGSEKVIRFLINKVRSPAAAFTVAFPRLIEHKMRQSLRRFRPMLWDRLSKKYDPTGEYKIKFQDKAKEAGIKV